MNRTRGRARTAGRAGKRGLRAGLVLVALAVAGQAAHQVRAGDVIRATFNAIKEPVRALHREKPATGIDGCVEQLAREIDWLEHHIDAYGTIVAKQPDVWGQSRLTQHRFEFEKTLAEELDRFEVRINGALRRSDQAYLGMALALQAAVNGQTTPPPLADATNQLSIVTGILEKPNEGDAVITRNAPFEQPDPKTGFSFENSTLSLEPTTQLNQMARYLQHLHELRRINEGDDTSDSPGYSLNLVRVPISVLPGGYTRKGYGAEITITATPYISDELLPITFRNLVINDLVDLLAPVITTLVNDPECREQAELLLGERIAKVQRTGASRGPELVPTPDSLDAYAPSAAAMETFGDYVQTRVPAQLNVPASKSRRAIMPLPASQVVDVFGKKTVAALVLRAFAGLSGNAVNKPLIHFGDVQGFLGEELVAAWELLAADSQRAIWESCPLDTLADLIRTRKTVEIASCREAFFGELPIQPSEPGMTAYGGPSPESLLHAARIVPAGLAWAVLVESALLNERLVQDVRETAVSKGCACMSGEWLPFYGPDPPPEARAAFVEYVKCRWPIIVFAIDPVTEEQNIADSFSRRRELQLAASMAFAAGNINAQTLMRFTRRLEWDMATIALNRTVIGFSHNNDTFGWRFYPRFQSPPIRGTLATLGETILGGPTTDQDLRQRQLEAGQRECTAIVIMPSFVPYVTFDTRANWFQLTHPKHTELSMRDTVKLSRSIKTMQNSRFACMRYAAAYREGEIHRLLRRVDQLERELPLQTMQVQVPYENTLGGFEMFNQGVTDLAPQLMAWYGEPGIHPNATTTLFLVGDHFSLHATKLVAGGKPVEFDMLSRQVLKVEIPPGVAVLADRDNKLEVDTVDVHLATPYGISNHLLIPLAPAGSLPAPSEGEVRWEETPSLALSYKMNDTDKKAVTVTMSPFFEAAPKQFEIETPRSSLMTATAAINFFIWHDSKAVGTFTVTSVPLDQRSGTYYLAGANLKKMVTDTGALNSTLEAYLKKRGEDVQPINNETLTMEASLVIGDRPVPVVGEVRVKVTRSQ